MLETNFKKFTYLSFIKNNPGLSCREIAQKTHKDFVEETTPEQHFKNTSMCLYRYVKYTKKLLKREKVNHVYAYSLSKHGRKRLRQMRSAKAYFGTYRLKWQGVQLLVKDGSNFSVNPDIIRYAADFCDVNEVQLWVFVKGYLNYANKRHSMS